MKTNNIAAVFVILLLVFSILFSNNLVRIKAEEGKLTLEEIKEFEGNWDSLSDSQKEKLFQSNFGDFKEYADKYFSNKLGTKIEGLGKVNDLNMKYKEDVLSIGGIAGSRLNLKEKVPSEVEGITATDKGFVYNFVNGNKVTCGIGQLKEVSNPLFSERTKVLQITGGAFDGAELAFNRVKSNQQITLDNYNGVQFSPGTQVLLKSGETFTAMDSGSLASLNIDQPAGTVYSLNPRGSERVYYLSSAKFEGYGVEITPQSDDLKQEINIGKDGYYKKSISIYPEKKYLEIKNSNVDISFKPDTKLFSYDTIYNYGGNVNIKGESAIVNLAPDESINVLRGLKSASSSTTTIPYLYIRNNLVKNAEISEGGNKVQVSDRTSWEYVKDLFSIRERDKRIK